MNQPVDALLLQPEGAVAHPLENAAARIDARAEAARCAAGAGVGISRPHESAHLHVAGEATYIDDIPELTGTLHAALGLAPVAAGTLTGMALDRIRALPGVVAVLSAADIPGRNDCGSIVHDDPILCAFGPAADGRPHGTIRYLGQPVFAVIAESRELARRAAAKARDVLTIEAAAPVLTPQEAHAKQQYVVPPMHIVRSTTEGGAQAAIAHAPRRLAGTFEVGGQEQFYLEGQISYALPKEGGAMHVHCSTQHPTEMQHLVARALGLHAHDVRVECRRMGGGFGGKESQSALFACVAAVAAARLQRPVKLRLDRDDDFLITGRRHCFWYEYEAGYDDMGRLLGVELTMVSRAGHSADLSGPVMTRALCHIDNAYWLPDVALHGYSGRTNTQSNTAFRGFGGPQGAIAIETILDSVARALGKDPLDVRRVNFYGLAAAPVRPEPLPVRTEPVEGPIIDAEASTSSARTEEAPVRTEPVEGLITHGGASTSSARTEGAPVRPEPVEGPIIDAGASTSSAGTEEAPVRPEPVEGPVVNANSTADGTLVREPPADRNPLPEGTSRGGAESRNVTPYGQIVTDNIIHALTAELETTSDYRARRAAAAAYNATSPVLKRGIALAPLKFGISFNVAHFNQAGALVHVYNDGSILVNHGGTEMGQGLNTKVAQVVAHELGVAFERVRCSATDTQKIPNTSATAASTGADLNGKAAQDAARQIRARLAACIAAHHGGGAAEVRFANDKVQVAGKTLPFDAVVAQAYLDRVQLWSDGFYATPGLSWDRDAMFGRPFYYFAYGAAVSEVVVDTLTGECKLLRADILHDAGRSLNPALDIGQIEGAFIQGMGWLTTEELVWHPETGKLTTHAPSTYKIPTANDCPPVLNTRLWEGDNVEDTIHRSKASGEPPLLLPFSVFFAIRDAVSAAGGHKVDPPLSAPATSEAILRALTAVRGG